MKKLIPGLVVFLISIIAISMTGYAQLKDSDTYYDAMCSGNISKINAQLAFLKANPESVNEAYLGAMMMKKAGFALPVGEKLNLFRSGRNKLESMIQKDKQNIEYHFLRVMIQENAPKFLNYRAELDKDCSLIRNSFEKVSPALQKVILDYCKNSKKLKLK